MSGEQKEIDVKATRALSIAYWRWGALIYVLSLTVFFYWFWWYPTTFSPNFMVWISIINFLIIWPVLICLSRFYVAIGITVGAYMVLSGGYGLPPLAQIFFYVVVGGLFGFFVDAIIGDPGFVTKDDRLSDETIESEAL